MIGGTPLAAGRRDKEGQARTGGEGGRGEGLDGTQYTKTLATHTKKKIPTERKPLCWKNAEKIVLILMLMTVITIREVDEDSGGGGVEGAGEGGLIQVQGRIRSRKKKYEQEMNRREKTARSTGG